MFVHMLFYLDNLFFGSVNNICISEGPFQVFVIYGTYCSVMSIIIEQPIGYLIGYHKFSLKRLKQNTNSLIMYLVNKI